MSRAAANAVGPKAKLAEIHERLAAAQAEAEAARAEAPPEVRTMMRAHLLFGHCKAAIVGRDRALWPGESIGAALAEMWMARVEQMLRQQLAAAQAEDVS